MRAMPAVPFPDRRQVLAGLGGAAALPWLGRPLLAQAPTDLLVVVLSDPHSAYERMAQTVAAIERAVAGAPALIVVNGDVFERGNVVALRSEGVLDWLFLSSLRRIAPVVLNLGNHETALVDDMAITVRMARERDISVVSNIVDRRTGQPYAPARAELDIAGRPVTVVGIATDEMMTYRQAVRPTLDLPEPASWAGRNLPGLLRAGTLNIVASHAGVTADRRILPLLPDGTLMIGGHEHLDFQHASGATRYLHTGSWNRAFTVVRARLGAPNMLAVERVAVEPNQPGDGALVARIQEVMRAHLASEDLVVVGRSSRALSLGDSARLLVGAMARAAGADVGLMSHTTLGTGLPMGDVTRFDMAAAIRFDGGMVGGDVDAATLRRIYGLANQDRDLPLEGRIGDFVHANEVDARADRRFRVVTTGWVRLNAMRYLGTDRIALSDVQTPTLRAILAGALS
jgi:2',3'-cyclic-nucleotide 2'-phosphodiesterase (5'-nucleotidase family)